MKVTIIFILLFFFQSISISQYGWVKQHAGVSNDLAACYFLNNNTGFITGKNGILLKTTNGGVIWRNIFNEINYDVSAIHFLNSNTGWAYIENNINEDSSFILKTMDGGTLWNKYFIDTNRAVIGISRIQFLDENTGYLTNYHSLKKTTNGGINWQVILNERTGDIHFLNSETGWAGVPMRRLFKTVDGGNQWEETTLPMIYHQLSTDIHFFDEKDGLYAGGWGYGWLYSTSNYGQNWNLYNNMIGIYKMSFPDNNNGYALAYSEFTHKYRIAKTTNRGLNWDLLRADIKGYDQSRITDIFFSSVYTGWVIGNSGAIYKTTNGGSMIGVNPVDTEIPTKFFLSQNYPNPFNPATKISFDIPASGFTELKIFDLVGREISNLVNEDLTAGKYEIDFNASHLPSGIYYYKLISGNFTQTKKMVLIK